MRCVVVAEKPSVARRIREALGRSNVIVTSVRGHILDSEFPEGFGWGRCDPLKLFDIREFRDEVRDAKAIRELRRIFGQADVLVIATDNDSEGELIGAEILKIWRSVRGDAPYKRMRFNSTDLGELRKAWRSLEDDLRWSWVMKALFRQRFDLIAGAAFTRLLTSSARRYYRNVRLISWGSCQAPTLWFIVKRELERTSFKPKLFWTIRATLETGLGERLEAESDRFWDRAEAQRAYEKASSAGYAVVDKFNERLAEILRPTPLRTDDMLRDLSRITGQPAAKILQVAESLYAEGYISYPRTDTNKYRPEFDFDQPLRAAAQGLGIKPPQARPNPRQGRLDDGAHTPIYPIAPYIGSGLGLEIWRYIARRFLANAFYADAVKRLRSAELSIAGIKLRSSGSELIDPGFFEVYGYFKPEDSPMPELVAGERLRIVSLRLHEGRTKPPDRLTEAELLKLMEEHGIGTDATRAGFPQLIRERGYAVKEKGAFKPTPLGMKLIEVLESIDPKLVTPETRRRVEELMSGIERGEITYEEALEKAAIEYKGLFKKLVERIDEKAAELASAIASPS
ncbi:MAG: type IA DNA topoisomerase [Nitrososphaerota archaeon]